VIPVFTTCTVTTAVGEELRGGRGGAYRVRDHYIARVFDVLELLRTATTAFR
jgi:hypothetical protein